MRILVTGGSGVLGRQTIPLLERGDHDVAAPPRRELDLFSADEVAHAVNGMDAVYHLATRIPPRQRMQEPAAWLDNDRLRTQAARLLVDAALAAGAATYVQPTVAFIYPPGAADETTLLEDVPPQLRSALVAEHQALRFAGEERRGIVLRLGLLYGPGTSNERDTRYGATLHVEDAGRALAAALTAPSGVYNVVENDNRVSNARFRQLTGWQPRT